MSRLRSRLVRPPRPKPPLPEGSPVGPPDFVGIGTQKAGTSWWWSLLLEHPRVRGPAVPKELHYFDGFCARPFSDDDVAAYHRCFPRTQGELAGEWTPRYVYDFWVPPLLRRAAPDATLLVLLRDPVERYRSGLGHSVQRGGKVDARTSGGAFARGLYASQLDRLFRHFPPEQVLVLQYERCRNDPAGQLRRSFEAIGVDPVAVPRARLGRRVNVTKRRIELGGDLLESLRRAYEPEVRRLRQLVPDLDLSWWPHFSDLG